LLAPTGTSAEIVTRLARAVSEAQQDADFVKTLRAQGFEPLRGGPEEFARYIETETVKWKRVAAAAGLTH
jgi:tripartite-type tricarboxylate transporter receptor subunit TctC